MEVEDKAGLDEAYQTAEGTTTKGDTLYIAGTKSPGDVVDDLAIPLGMTDRTQRYRDASLVLNANPTINRVVGHSLGGAVALQLQKDDPKLQTVTYGAPVASTTGSSDRYREIGDPVAALYFGAVSVAPGGVNPHSYDRLAKGRLHLVPTGVSREIR